jgi:hypothetical protein
VAEVILPCRMPTLLMEVKSGLEKVMQLIVFRQKITQLAEQ